MVTYRSGSLESAPFHEDDVHLHLRGRVKTAPTPGRLNVLWVISHPDTVESEELGAFDLVLAGSTSWAAESDPTHRANCDPTPPGNCDRAGLHC